MNQTRNKPNNVTYEERITAGVKWVHRNTAAIPNERMTKKILAYMFTLRERER